MSLAKFLERKNLKGKAELLRKELGQENSVSESTVGEQAASITKEDINETKVEDMSKKELDTHAEKNYDIKLDRRKSKSAMTKDFYKKSKNKTQ